MKTRALLVSLSFVMVLPLALAGPPVDDPCHGKGQIERRWDEENEEWIKLFYLYCSGDCASGTCQPQHDPFTHPAIYWCGCGGTGTEPGCCSLAVTGAINVPGPIPHAYGDGWAVLGECGNDCNQPGCYAQPHPGPSLTYYTAECP